MSHLTGTATTQPCEGPSDSGKLNPVSDNPVGRCVRKRDVSSRPQGPQLRMLTVYVNGSSVPTNDAEICASAVAFEPSVNCRCDRREIIGQLRISCIRIDFDAVFDVCSLSQSPML